MTRDPQIDVVTMQRQAVAADRKHLRSAIHRGAVAVTLVAGGFMLAAQGVLRMGLLGPPNRWMDLLVAGLVGLSVTVVKHIVWPRAMLCDPEGRAQRRNAILLVLPIAVVCSYYFIGGGRAAHASLLGASPFAVCAAVICGAAMAWAASLAQVEYEIGFKGRTSAADQARAVGMGVMGLVLLIIALGVVRRFEYIERFNHLQPTAGLVDLAGRQQTFSISLGRALARIDAEQKMDQDVRERLNAALSRFQAEGGTLETSARDWELLRSAEVDGASRTLLARASAMRGKIMGYANAVLDDYRKQADPAANTQRLQAAIDEGLPAFESLVDTFQAAGEHGRRELELTMRFGFGLLAMVALGGGIGVSRAVWFVVRRQRMANAAHAATAYRLAAVARNTTNLVIMTDMAGRISWANASFERVTGYTLEEAIGQHPGEMLQCKETDMVAIAQMRDAIARCESSTVEILNQGKAGNRYWLQLTIKPLYEERGVHYGFISIQTDITEAVVLREQRHGIFEAMAAGVVVENSDGIIVDCNSAACRMLGLDAEQLCGRGLIDACWRAIREDGTDMPDGEHFGMHTLQTGQAVTDGVMGVDTPNGSRVWLNISTRLMAEAQTGRRSVISTFTDITRRKRAEIELSIERTRLSAALDGTGAGVWRWRIEDGLVDVDSRWFEIAAGESPATDCVPIGEWMRRLHPDDAAIAVEAAAMHRCGVSERFDIEVRIRGTRGHWTWVHCRGRVDSTNANGEARSMIGTLMDISARREVAVESAVVQEKLQRLFDLAPFGVALADSGDSRVLDCNQALLDMFRMSRGDLLQCSLRSLTPPEYDSQWLANTATMDLAGRCGPFEKEYLVADGDRVPVQVTAQRVQLADGSSAVWVVVQDLTARKLMEDGLYREARTDKLTGLANRAALMERIEVAIEAARIDPLSGFGLLFLDFDRFKLVNDTLGHAAGDELLCRIAERLRKAMRKTLGTDGGGSFVARIGGDEFVVLVPWTSDLVAINTVAQRLLASLAAPYVVCGSELQSSASIGVVSSCQADLDASTILRNADTAMYAAKRLGRGQAVVYDTNMHARLQREVLIERNLRNAVALGEVSIVYQPIVDLETGELASLEALARWHSAELGEVSPSEFIPIAEDCGVIAELGEWVLYEACDQFADWVAHHPDARATISVNLSRVQMGTPVHLLQMIESTLETTGLAPNRLQLEVTERDVMRDPTAILALIRRLRAIGVRLAMDDFGTGTSSLACLRDYPFDVIKIDRAFVGDLESDSQVLALVHATMMLIENLGMVSVAEGVETHAQAAILQSLGCRLGQGWLFGRPVALSDIPASSG